MMIADSVGHGPVLQEAARELEAGLAELRELARGLHPAVLTDHGLEVALRSIRMRLP